MKINSEQEMIEYGIKFIRQASLRLAEGSLLASRPLVFELIGDVGTGKTTLVRGIAQGLGIEEPVTSPSFTISKSYACPDGRTLIHYDFYRLDDPGLMAEDLEENLKNPHNIVVIEWSDTVKDILPKDHITVNIKYNDDGSREVETLE